MPLEKENIRKLAHLSAISLSDHEVEEMTKKFSAVKEALDKIGAVNTDGIEPMYSVSAELQKHIVQIDKSRKESSIDGATEIDVTEYSKNKEGRYFTVPKVIE